MRKQNISPIWGSLTVLLVLGLVTAGMWRLADQPPKPEPLPVIKYTQLARPKRVQVYVIEGVGKVPPSGDFTPATLKFPYVSGHAQILSADSAEAAKQVKEIFGTKAKISKSVVTHIKPDLPPPSVSAISVGSQPPRSRLDKIGEAQLVRLSDTTSIVAPQWCVSYQDEAALVPLNLPVVDKDRRIVSWSSAPQFGVVPLAGGTVFVLNDAGKYVYVTVEMW